MILRKLTIWTLIAAASTLVSGCSRSQSEQESLEIVPRARIGSDPSNPSNSSGSALSGAVSKSQQDGVLENGAEVTMFFSRADSDKDGLYGSFSTSLIKGNIPAGSGVRSITFTPKQRYNSNLARKTKLVGFYPKPQQADVAAGSVSWALNGKVDVMTAAIKEGKGDSPMGAFAFEHKMVQVQIWMVADNGEVQPSFMSAHFQDVPLTCTYNYNGTGEVVFSNNGEYTYDYPDFKQPSVGSVLGHVCTFLMPEQANGVSNTLLFKDSGGRTTIEFSVGPGFKAGKAYRLEVHFLGRLFYIKNVTMTDWVAGVATDGEIELQ